MKLDKSAMITLLSLFILSNLVLAAIDHWATNRESITWLENLLFSLFFTAFYSLRYVTVKRSSIWHKDYKKDK